MHFVINLLGSMGQVNSLEATTLSQRSLALFMGCIWNVLSRGWLAPCEPSIQHEPEGRMLLQVHPHVPGPCSDDARRAVTGRTRSRGMQRVKPPASLSMSEAPTIAARTTA